MHLTLIMSITANVANRSEGIHVLELAVLLSHRRLAHESNSPLSKSLWRTMIAPNAKET